ncbi:MAG: hypothetical protein WBY94_22645 [Polyangiaceae bacterium]
MSNNLDRHGRCTRAFASAGGKRPTEIPRAGNYQHDPVLLNWRRGSIDTPTPHGV